MLMINTAETSIRVPSDLVEDWGDSEGARPEKVTIPAGAVLAIRDEYALRSLGANAARDADTGELLAGSTVAARAMSLSGDMLKPHGPDALKFYETTFVADLPQVRRQFAEDARKAKHEQADRFVTRDAMETAVAERVREVMNAAAPASLPIAPAAVPRFVVEPKSK